MGRRKSTIDPEKEKYWRDLFARFHKSGKPFRKFCEDEGVSPNTFQYWRKELRQRDEERGKVSAIRKGDNRPSQVDENLEYWGKILEDIQAYPGSVNSFCKKYGISSGNLHYWKMRLADQGKEPKLSPATNAVVRLPESKIQNGHFVELHVVPQNDAEEKASLPKPEMKTDKSADFIEVVIPGGCAVRITHDSDLTLLSRLLSFMEEKRC